MKNNLYETPIQTQVKDSVSNRAMSGLKAPPGVTLASDAAKVSSQLSQLAADQARARKLLLRILDSQVVYTQATPASRVDIINTKGESNG